jgi:hypothetical protein
MRTVDRRKITGNWETSVTSLSQYVHRYFLIYLNSCGLFTCLFKIAFSVRLYEYSIQLKDDK